MKPRYSPSNNMIRRDESPRHAHMYARAREDLLTCSRRAVYRLVKYRTVPLSIVSCRMCCKPHKSVSELTLREGFDFGELLPVVFASSARTCRSIASTASTLCRLVASSPQHRSLPGPTSCSRTRRGPQTRLVGSQDQ